jgi:hypothetical protein
VLKFEGRGGADARFVFDALKLAVERAAERLRCHRAAAQRQLALPLDVLDLCGQGGVQRDRGQREAEDRAGVLETASAYQLMEPRHSEASGADRHDERRAELTE